MQSDASYFLATRATSNTWFHYLCRWSNVYYIKKMESVYICKPCRSNWVQNQTYRISLSKSFAGIPCSIRMSIPMNLPYFSMLAISSDSRTTLATLRKSPPNPLWKFGLLVAFSLKLLVSFGLLPRQQVVISFPITTYLVIMTMQPTFVQYEHQWE